MNFLKKNKIFLKKQESILKNVIIKYEVFLSDNFLEQRRQERENTSVRKEISLSPEKISQINKTENLFLHPFHDQEVNENAKI